MAKKIDIDLITNIFSILWEPNKLKIFIILKNKELCICEIIKKMNIKQNMVSHHVSILKRAWFLNFRKNWTKAFYSLNMEMYKKVKKNINLLFNI